MKNALLIYDASQWPTLLSSFSQEGTAWTTSEQMLHEEIEAFDAVVSMKTGYSFTHYPKKVLLINDTAGVERPIGNTPCPVVRFCGWKTFADRKVWEVASCDGTADDRLFEAIAGLINRKLVVVKDLPGLVAPRVVATIINEALFTLADGVCSASDLDLAMQLGTNYPYGPIEWLRKIGNKEVMHLLETMAALDARYEPHPMIRTNDAV
jgi:3-hydroxybutyryl-CoA dehydrogenase